MIKRHEPNGISLRRDGKWLWVNFLIELFQWPFWALWKVIKFVFRNLFTQIVSGGSGGSQRFRQPTTPPPPPTKEECRRSTWK